MMKRILLALALIVGLAAPAYATEINTDTGCDSSGAWMLQTGWTVTGSKCVGTSVSAMKMLMQMTNAVKAGHRYRLTFTLSGYAAGQVRGFVGVTMPSAPTGSYITAASVSDIADNFTTASGLAGGYTPKNLTGPGDSSEVGGAFRFGCNSAGFGFIDPLVYPNLSSPHLHEFYGNSGVGKNWTFTDFRTKGSSSCGNRTDPTHPIVRTGYWEPAMFDGLGNIKRAALITVYYKGPSDPATITSITATGTISNGAGGAGTTLTITGGPTGGAIGKGTIVTGTGVTANTNIMSGSGSTWTVDKSQNVASTTLTISTPYIDGPLSDVTNDCANTTPAPHTCIFAPPRGLRMTFGYKPSDGTCGPLDTTNQGSPGVAGCSFRAHVAFDCWGGPNNEGGTKGQGYTTVYRDLASLMNANVCAKGSWLHMGGDFPYCWDGVNVDSPNHRDHMSWGDNAGNCDAAHPVRMVGISIQVFFSIDQAFLDHKWKLASDEMATTCSGGAVTAGCTYHADYWEAWSPTVRQTWSVDCIQKHNSCSTEIGDGNGLKGGGINYDGTDINQNGGQLIQPNDKVPFTHFGMTKDYTANGTYTVEFVSPADGVWGFMGLNSFSGSLDSISLTEIPGAKGPVTVHN